MLAFSREFGNLTSATQARGMMNHDTIPTNAVNTVEKSGFGSGESGMDQLLTVWMVKVWSPMQYNCMSSS